MVCVVEDSGDCYRVMYFVALVESLKVSSAGIAFVDSIKLAVCHNKRIYQHRVFADSATRGKTSVDWFYGFKIHLILNILATDQK